MGEHPDVRVIAVPYDSGHRGLRMGAGPEHLLNNGLGETLLSAGLSPSFATVRPEGDPPAEVATAFEIARLVSARAREAASEGGFPLVISGNCNASVGTLAGAGPEGIVWFDAHPDFTDGMGLAVAVGHCWRTMAGAVPGFSPVAEANVVLAGIRDAQPAEMERLAASDVAVVDADRLGHAGLPALAAALDGMKSRGVDRVYVHLDLDVLDAGSVGRANGFAPEGGLDAETLLAALGMVRGRFAVAAVGIASYDPSFDANGRVLRTALACLRTLAPPATPAIQAPDPAT
jgi:arginase